MYICNEINRESNHTPSSGYIRHTSRKITEGTKLLDPPKGVRRY